MHSSYSSYSRESFASDDFTAPIVERRLTPQQRQQQQHLPPQTELPDASGMEAPPLDEEPTKEDGSTLSKCALLVVTFSIKDAIIPVTTYEFKI